MDIEIQKCPYCRGTGKQYVEHGSSLSYRCPDCHGTGEIQKCGVCGRVIEGDYCDFCFAECSECKDIVPIYSLYNGLCPDCQGEKHE